MAKYLKHCLIGLDQLFNALILGWPDETFSSGCWRNRYIVGWGVLRWCIDLLFFWDKNHCQGSFESERIGRQKPPKLR